MNSRPLSTGTIRGVNLEKGLSSDQTIEFTGVLVAFGLNLNAEFVYIHTESVI